MPCGHNNAQIEMLPVPRRHYEGGNPRGAFCAVRNKVQKLAFAALADILYNLPRSILGIAKPGSGTHPLLNWPPACGNDLPVGPLTLQVFSWIVSLRYMITKRVTVRIP